MFESLLARRYLRAAQKQKHTAFLSLISMLGLAVGVATLLISLALLSGLQGQIKRRLIASSPLILIQPSRGTTIDGAPGIISAAREAGVTRIEAIVSGVGWGANATQRRGRPLRIRSSADAAPSTGDNPRISLTREAAGGLGLDIGGEVMVVAPRTRLTPFGPMPVWRKYRISRLLPPPPETGGADASLPMEEADRLFATNGRPTSIEMYGDVERAEGLQSILQQRFPEVQVKTWKEINRPLFLALRLEKVVMFVTISLIIFVAALNLISSMSMLVLEKRPQVGILRTLGATERSILSVFLQLGLLIGLTGTLLGNAIGLGVSWMIDRYHLIQLPPEMYFISYLPFSIDAADVIGVNVIAVFLSIVATWYPARAASRLDPIVAISQR